MRPNFDLCRQCLCSSAYRLREVRIGCGHRVEHGLDLGSDCFALSQETFNLGNELLLVSAETANRRQLTFQLILFLTQGLGELDGPIDFVFEMREFFEPVQCDHRSLLPDANKSARLSDFMSESAR